MMRPDRSQQVMKRFWDAKAREHPQFYIATWRGYDRTDTEDFFLSPEEAATFVDRAGYRPTGHDRMLEIGCGIGRMTHGFAQLFGEVHAIDVSGEMIRQAREHLGEFDNVHLYETSGVDLSPFANDSMDFCFSFIVFQHIPDKAVIFNYIREAGRVLRPRGIFHFQVNGLANPDIGTPRMLLIGKRVYRRFVRRPALLLRDRLRGGPGGFASPAWAGVSLTVADVGAACRDAQLADPRVTGEHTQYMWVTTEKPASA
jgi:SAM-dependent methyltransferase